MANSCDHDCTRTLTCPRPAEGGDAASTSSGGGASGGDGGAAAECGDGTLQGGEECDDGNDVDADGCESDCTLPRCGNGIVDPGEVCFTHPYVEYALEAEGFGALAVLDCDRVGDLDVIADPLTVLRNDGAGAFPEIIVSPTGYGTLAYALASGDVNGDSLQDVVSANHVSSPGQSTITVFVGDGLGGLTASDAGAVPIGAEPVSVALADLNGDGALDIITTTGLLVAGTTHVNVLLADP